MYSSTYICVLGDNNGITSLVLCIMDKHKFRKMYILKTKYNALSLVIVFVIVLLYFNFILFANRDVNVFLVIYSNIKFNPKHLKL